MDKIKFGTDGWRGVIADDFTFANVRRVAAAIAQYVREESEPARDLIVGYDMRFLSAEFAQATAEVLSAAGIRVCLADTGTPTPAVSYAVVARQTAGAVMITASHNPSRWNGVKFKAPYGGSAEPAIIHRIETHLHRLDRAGTRARKVRPAAIEVVDLTTPYLERLKQLVSLDQIRASGQRFVIDPMFGAGRGCISRLFIEARIPFREIHSEHNPLFPGMNPEPIEPHVEGLRRAVMEGKFDGGFATDGDADRIGAIDRTGEFIDSMRSITAQPISAQSFSSRLCRSPEKNARRPAGIPETRFHFKTEVMRFGRVGNTCTHRVYLQAHNGRSTKGEIFVTCRTKRGQ